MSDCLLELLLTNPVPPVAVRKVWHEPPPARHFWSCDDCLSVMATDGNANYSATDDKGYNVVTLRCACGGTVEYMGRVRRDSLIRTELQCACDGRCTGARGPNCDCQCGGANHGTGAVVEVVISTSGVPVVTPVDNRAMARAAEYRAAVEAARARLEWAYRLIERKRAGEWINEWSRYMDACDAIKALGVARGYRTHARRIKALEAIGCNR